MCHFKKINIDLRVQYHIFYKLQVIITSQFETKLNKSNPSCNSTNELICIIWFCLPKTMLTIQHDAPFIVCMLIGSKFKLSNKFK